MTPLLLQGSSSEDLELIDELLKEHELAPPLNAEIIKGNHIGILGAKLILSAFQVPETRNNNGEGDSVEEIVNLSLTMLKSLGPD